MLIVYTGNGKGKSCAAFGQVLRALGWGMRVCVVQFIKSRPSGELLALEDFAKQAGEEKKLELHQLGIGFSWQVEDKERFREAALSAWRLALSKIEQDFQLLLFDELTYLVSFDIISEAELLSGLGQRREGQHIVVSGRDASAGLIANADIVSEIQEIKHPFAKGVKAAKGIEY